MGIDNLTKLVKAKAPSAISEVTLETYANSYVTVDLSSYLFQYMYNAERKGKGSHIRGFFEMIVAFSKYNIKPIFIKDGKASQAKNRTLEKRTASKQAKVDKISELVQDISSILEIPDLSVSDVDSFDLETVLLKSEVELTPEKTKKITQNLANISKQKKNIITIKGSMFRDLDELFRLCKVNCFKAKEEADFLCVKLCKAGISCAVFSEDMDILTHGAMKLIRGINDMPFRRNGILREHSLETLLEGFGMSQTEFIDTCILCGCDYATSPYGIGNRTAYNLIKAHGTIEKIVELAAAGVLKYKIEDGFTYKEARDEFKKSDLETLPEINRDWSASDIDESKLLDFLLSNSNYTAKTAKRKISELKASSNSSVPTKTFTVIQRTSENQPKTKVNVTVKRRPVIKIRMPKKE